jgi:hypothetical protein
MFHGLLSFLFYDLHFLLLCSPRLFVLRWRVCKYIVHNQKKTRIFLCIETCRRHYMEVLWLVGYVDGCAWPQTSRLPRDVPYFVLGKLSSAHDLIASKVAYRVDKMSLHPRELRDTYHQVIYMAVCTVPNLATSFLGSPGFLSSMGRNRLTRYIALRRYSG